MHTSLFGNLGRKAKSIYVNNRLQFFLLNAVFLICLIGNGQTVEILNYGSGIASSGNIISGTNKYHASEHLYFDSEIGASNFISAGTAISKISVRAINVSSSTTINNIKVYCRNVSGSTTTLSNATYSTAGYTLVFSGNLTVVDSNWVDITLTTPFIRTSGSNLQVMFERLDGVIPAWVSTNIGFLWRAQFATNGTTSTLVSRRANSATAITSSTILGASIFRAAIRLISGTTSVTPTVATIGSIGAFTACNGTASTQQSFTVSGSNLTANAILNAPTGFEISTNPLSGYASSLTLTQSGGSVASTIIYARMAASATGTPSGNITVASTGATTQNVAVSGTVNAVPSITLGSVANISAAATSFSLPYSAATGNPNQYSITAGAPTAMPGFTAVSNATLGVSPIAVTIPASGGGTYNFVATVRNSTTGCVSAELPFTVTIAGPTTTATGTLNNFTACSGSAATAQTITVGGSNLTANLVVTAPTGFEVSTSSGSGYASSLSLTPSSGTVSNTTVYVRMSASATGTPSGNVTVASTGAATQNIAATGTVNALPTITLGTVTSVFSNATSFSLPFSASTGSPNQYSITTGSPTAMSSFTAVNNATLGTSPISVTIPASTPATYNFIATVRNSTTGCVSANNAFTVQVVPAPVVSISGTMTAFATCIGTASAAQSFTVSGTNLIANAVVTAPTGYEVSTSVGSGYGASVSVTPASGTVTSTTVYIRLSSAAPSGANNGNITISSTSATSQTLAVTGSVGATVTAGNNPSVVNGTTSANLFYGSPTGSPDQYNITWSTAATTAGFADVAFIALPPTSISITIPNNPGNGVYTGTLVLKNSGNGCVSPNIPFSITVAPPTITPTSTMTSFSSCVGTASAVQGFNVSGSSLTANVNLTAPTGYEISTSNNSGFASSLSLTPQSGTISATVYVRLSNAASGTPAGNITLVSANAEATAQNVAVSGTVNALPTITPLAVSPVLTSATNFILPYNASGSPNQYSITTSAPTAMPNFTAVNNANVTGLPLNVPIPASAGGTYNFNVSVLNTTTGCVSAAAGFTVTVTNPTITSTGTLNNFTACSGSAATAQTITVSGSNLTANLVVTAPTGFEVSTSSGSGYAGSVSITPTANTVSSTTIYVRLNSNTVGGQNGNVIISSTGATSQTIAASGTVNALPSVTFTAVSNISNVATSFQLPYTASATTGNPNQYSITAGTPTAMSAFTPVTNATLGASPIAVTVPASAIGTYNFTATVRNSTTGCVSAATNFTVQVTGVAPTVTVSGSLSAVPTTYGTPSASPTFFTVNGSSLTNNVVVTAPAGYEVSTSTNSGYSGSVTITQNAGSVSNAVVYVRLAATTVVGSYSGNVSVASTGATTQNVATVSSAVSAAPLSIDVNDVFKIYGQVLTNSTGFTDFSVTGLKNGESIGSISVAYGTGAAATSAVGIYTGVVTPSAATGGTFTASNYSITYNAADITVNPAALTITASNVSKTYGAVASLGTTAFTTSGLLNSDAVSAVTLASTGSGATAAVGTYPITAASATGTGLTNYTITYTDGTLTVNPAALTITASNTAKTYGAAATLTQYTTSGLVNSDAVSAVTLASTGAAATSAVGTYPITAASATGTGLTNYTITYNNGTLTVNPAALTITASNAAKTYGAAATLTQFTTSGLVNTDAVSAVTLNSTGSAATAAVGTYPITAASATGTGLTNYTITYNNGTLTVNPAALTITASSAAKTYGSAATLTQYTASGLVNADAVSAVALSSTGSAATAAVGTYPITAASATGTGLANYTITYNNGTLTVNPAALTITASNAAKTYGAAASLTQYTTSGLVNSDAVSAVTLASTGAAATAAVGTYPITAASAMGTGLTNYTITYTDGTLTVNPAALTITASNAVKTYGSAATLTQYTTSGLLNGDAVSAVTLASTGAAATVAVGTYPITASSATGTGLTNYTITYTNGTLTVNPAALTITANNANKFYGLTLNPSQFTATGLLNSDAVSGVTLASTGSPATASVGTYPITASSATGTGLTNYTITYTNGTMTILPISLTITAANQVKCQGDVLNLPANGYGVNGLVNNDAVSAVSLSSTGTGSGAAAGIYPIVASAATGTGLSNYTISYINGTLTVNALPVVSATASSAAVSKGRNVTLSATGTGSFAWSPVAGIVNPNSATTEARVTARTTYTVTLTAANSCRNTASVTVDAIEDFYVEPAVVFTPNGDGINDRFVIKNLDQYPQNKLQVFDRTGKVLYEYTNYSNNWDGTINGKTLTKDTYFYVLTVRGQIVKRGSITVVR